MPLAFYSCIFPIPMFYDSYDPKRPSNCEEALDVIQMQVLYTATANFCAGGLCEKCSQLNILLEKPKSVFGSNRAFQDTCILVDEKSTYSVIFHLDVV